MTKVTDVWETKLDVEEDMDRVQVVRRVPTVMILLSLEPLDPAAPGCVHPVFIPDLFVDSWLVHEPLARVGGSDLTFFMGWVRIQVSTTLARIRSYPRFDNGHHAGVTIWQSSFSDRAVERGSLSSQTLSAVEG
jgi:hypothetical protein